VEAQRRNRYATALSLSLSSAPSFPHSHPPPPPSPLPVPAACPSARTTPLPPPCPWPCIRPSSPGVRKALTPLRFQRCQAPAPTLLFHPLRPSPTPLCSCCREPRGPVPQGVPRGLGRPPAGAGAGCRRDWGRPQGRGGEASTQMAVLMGFERGQPCRHTREEGIHVSRVLHCFVWYSAVRWHCFVSSPNVPVAYHRNLQRGRPQGQRCHEAVQAAQGAEGRAPLPTPPALRHPLTAAGQVHGTQEGLACLRRAAAAQGHQEDTCGREKGGRGGGRRAGVV